MVWRFNVLLSIGEVKTVQHLAYPRLIATCWIWIKSDRGNQIWLGVFRFNHRYSTEHWTSIPWHCHINCNGWHSKTKTFVFKVERLSYIQISIGCPCLTWFRFNRSLSVSDKLSAGLFSLVCANCSGSFSIFPLWTFHLYVVTFQQHLHMEYISLRWYDIPELVVPISISLIEGCC
jgi:hypothetical protein